MKTIRATKFVKSQLNGEIEQELTCIEMSAQGVLNTSKSKAVRMGAYPFSIIISIPNIWGFRSPLVMITDYNRGLLQSEYVARRKNEIPYLKRWFPKSSIIGEVGHHLDVICYTKAQLAKEGTPIKADYGIVAINVELEKSSPVPPSTMLNNHLGIQYGGNGMKLNKKEYLKSVKFWQDYAMVYEG